MTSLLDHSSLISLSILIHLDVPIGPMISCCIISLWCWCLVGVVISPPLHLLLLLCLSFLGLLGVQGWILIPPVLLLGLYWGSADCHALTLERQWTVVLGIAHASLGI